MKIANSMICALITIALLFASSGCGPDEPGMNSDSHEEDDAATAAAPTNRIDVPASVRRNLGITFAEAELRTLERTLRVPGAFELRPEARREYHAMLPGRVELLVNQFDHVEAGDVLLRLDSPAWRQHQHQAVEAQGEIKLAEAALLVAEANLAENRSAADFLAARIGALNDANVRKVELEAELHALRNTLPRLQAEVEARQVHLAEAHEHYESMLNILSSISGYPAAELLAESERGPDAGDLPLWRTIEVIEVRAEAPGVVDELPVTGGGWVEVGDLALTTIDPTRIRFRATALQADLAQLRSSMRGEVVPADAGALDAVEVAVVTGFHGRADQRTMPLYASADAWPPWALPGVSAYLEVNLDPEAPRQLAIPREAVVQDGIQHIFFLRDRDDPDAVIRTPADLGVEAGRWVGIQSGLRIGDEVVIDGAYELMLAGAGQPRGGHFHADGTFHAEDH